ncbi:MAG: DNA polymerase III subunit delta [Desulfuromonadales bacterium]|nr:DNA polymerase III subunit delta [Desulfuromonadales bacterium]
MTPVQLQQLIRQQKIPELLMLYGSEGFLVEGAVRQIRAVLLAGGGEDFNFNQFYAKEAPADEIVAAARTLPVFAERRLVLIKEIHLLPAASQEVLQDYLKDPVPETCLLCTGEKIDSRRKFFQLFKKVGEVVEFKSLYDNQLPAFVREQLSDENYEITGEALTLFCSRVGTNLHEVRAELAKLQTYLGERRLVDVADVQAVVSSIRSENVFEIGNAVARGETGRAFSLARRLVDEGEAPLKILSLLVRHYRHLWQIRELLGKGVASKQIAGQVGLPPFFIDGMIRQAKQISGEDCRRAFELFLQTDLAMKSSGADPDALLDQLLLNLAVRHQDH